MTSPTALDRRSLLLLRWVGTGALAGVLGAGLAGWLPSPDLPVAGCLLATASLLNVLLSATDERAVGWILLADTLVITAMLAASGGVSNPFTLLYLFPVLVASLVLSPSWTAALAIATTVAFAGLYWVSPAHHHMDMSQHLVGMVAAYAVTVPVLGAGVHRFRTATREAELEQERARQSRDAAERLASLAALAGGAAHELATPLSTILLVARELETISEGEVAADLALISAQVLECKEIISTLAMDAGGLGGARTPVDLQAFLQGVLAGLDVTLTAPSTIVEVPENLLAQAVRRLVGNAGDAGASAVQVTAAVTEGLRVEVSDDGSGMPADVLARACDPFFTTKPNGDGRGLGLFFVHSVARQLGGDFELHSTPGEGTTATLSLPTERPCASS